MQQVQIQFIPILGRLSWGHSVISLLSASVLIVTEFPSMYTQNFAFRSWFVFTADSNNDLEYVQSPVKVEVQIQHSHQNISKTIVSGGMLMLHFTLWYLHYKFG